LFGNRGNVLQALRFAESADKASALPARAADQPPLGKDHGPGEHAERDEQEKHGLGDRAGLKDEINDFAADKRDIEAIAQCFTKDAVVKDEGHTYTGVMAIKQWKAETSTKYTYTSEPFALEQRDGTTVVTSRLTGNFPGSPVDLRFFFRLERGKIEFLEITP